MDFDKAIAVHVDWKEKLRTYIKRKDKSLNPSIIEQDNQCELGKWIYGEGSKYQSHKYYQELKDNHAEFHKCAAEIVRQIDRGNESTAETLMDANSNYRELSIKVVTKIRKLRDAVEAKNK